MRIADSAKFELNLLLATSEHGDMLSMLIGYTYDEDWNKTPQISITVLPAATARSMMRDYSEAGEELVREYGGFMFAVPIPDDEGLLEGWVLTYSAAGFSLIRANS